MGVTSMFISNSARASRKQLTKKFMRRWLLSRRDNPFADQPKVVSIFDKSPDMKKAPVIAKQK